MWQGDGSPWGLCFGSGSCTSGVAIPLPAKASSILARSSVSGVSPTTMVCFRAGTCAEDLAARARKGGVGGAARRDLGRYYLLLRVALAGSPPLSVEQTEELVRRGTAALETEGGNGVDLTALVFACAEVLPGWAPLQLLALADALERAPRDPGGRLTPEAVLGVLDP